MKIDSLNNLYLKNDFERMKELKKEQISNEFEVDFSKIDNSLEFALLPFNDAYVMSKVLQKLKEQGSATIEGKLNNLDMKLVFTIVNSKQNVNTYIVRVNGKIGDNEIKSDIFLNEGSTDPNLKNQLFLKNLGVFNGNSFLVNSLWSETFDQWGFQKLSVSNINSDSAQLTLTYDPEDPNNIEKIYYKVKQDCTCTKEIVNSTYISSSSKSQNKDETKMKMTVSTDLNVEGTIKNNSNKISFNYQIK
jgi:flagellar basal body rod protein FlgC